MKKKMRQSPEQGLFSFHAVKLDAPSRYVAELITNHLTNDIPCKFYCKHELPKRSYSRWASFELLERISDRDDPPLLILEQFRDKMNEYARAYPSSADIFTTASETAEYFIRLLD